MRSSQVGSAQPQAAWLVRRLRSLTPTWPVSRSEARWIAEQQARLLIAETGIASPPVPMRIVTELEGINIYLLPQMPVRGLLGASKPNAHGGDILIDCNVPLPEQRVTLMHELKHVIDGGHTAKPHKAGRQSSGEGLCTAFAMSVLVPADWLRRDWLEGIRSISALAERYQVPIGAMEHRLHGLGFLKRARARAGLALCQWQPDGKENERGNS